MGNSAFCYHSITEGCAEEGTVRGLVGGELFQVVIEWVRQPALMKPA
jgi:hypothetical protein